MPNRPQTWLKNKILKEGLSHPLYSLNRVMAFLYKLEIIPQKRGIWLSQEDQERYNNLYYRLHKTHSDTNTPYN